MRDQRIQTIAEVGAGGLALPLLAGCSEIRRYWVIGSGPPVPVDEGRGEGRITEAGSARARVEWLHGDLLQVRVGIPDGSLDLAFLGGDSSLRGVVIGALSLWPKLREGGVLAGDGLEGPGWREGRGCEPSLVDPFVRYFADAMGEELQVLPRGGYAIRKTRDWGFGDARPASAGHGLGALLEGPGSPPTGPRKGRGGWERGVGWAKRAAKALLRRGSPRYREFEAVRRSGERFPAHFSTTGLVFIHVPKAAGTSISLALYGRAGGHTPLAHYWHEYPHSMRRMHTFAVFRDPVARFVSAFHYLKKGGLNSIDAEFAASHLSRFSTPSELAEALISGALQFPVLGFMHFRPQTDWIHDPLGGRVVDSLVLLEQLDLLRSWIRSTTGRAVEFPVLNVGPVAHGDGGGLSASAQVVLRGLYARDFEICRQLREEPGCMCPVAAQRGRGNSRLLACFA